MSTRAGVKAALAGRPPWPGVSDEDWFWAHTKGRRSEPRLAEALPGMPPTTVQETFTGRSGDDTLAEGFAVYRLFRSLYGQHAERPLGRGLDFGCGWGRILRFWLRECAPDNLVGIDRMGTILGHARRAGAPYRLERCDVLPPTSLESESFDLVYAYSVFSHLPEETHLAWLPELRRVLRPGGVFIATTFPRSHIELHSTFRADRHRTGRPGFVHEAFLDTERWLTRYDRGEFCFSGRPADPHFGDACVPERYVREVWAKWFEVLDYICDPARCAQNVVVTRKPIQEQNGVNPGLSA